MTVAAGSRRGAVIGGMPAIDPCWDARFRELTGLGNAAFHAGDDATAGGHYRAALAEAERLFSAASRESGAILIAPMALTIAANNLAAAMMRAGLGEAARSVSRGTAERLIAAAEAVDRPIALRLNCLRHLPRALAFATEFFEEPDPALERLARRAGPVADEVMRVAELWRLDGEVPRAADRACPRADARGSGVTRQRTSVPD